MDNVLKTKTTGELTVICGETMARQKLQAVIKFLKIIFSIKNAKDETDHFQRIKIRLFGSD